MDKIKKFFATPKKAVLTIICLILLLAIAGTGVVFAANAVAEGTSIGEDKAKNFAFADAGVDPASAEHIRAEFDFEHGNFIYEVEFTANGTEYDYWVKASDGSILKKELEIVSYTGDRSTITAEITLDEAIKIALENAALTESEVTLTKKELDMDNGISVYDIEFYTNEAEYEYEINAASGVVYSKSKETFITKEDDTNQNTAEKNSIDQNDQDNTGKDSNHTEQDSSLISIEDAKTIVLSDAGVTSQQITYTKEKLDYEDGTAVYDIEFYTSTSKYEYEVNAKTGSIRSKEAEDFQSGSGSEGSGNTDSYIGIDEAKSIAVRHAGFSVSEVTFSKTKLEKEHGTAEYEIEFYQNGWEYEYTINASTGDILEYDIDR